MSLRRAAAATAAVLLCLAAVSGARQALRARRAASLRAERDRVQLEAQRAESAGHPWAGVYIAMNEIYADGTLMAAPDGAFAASTYERYQPVRTAYAFGRAAFAAPLLTLSPDGPAKGERSRFTGSYRLVRWGGVRCLIRPGDERRFLDCAASECADFHPLCTRGVLSGEPDLPEELARARREDPLYRPVRIVSIRGPYRRSWGWQYMLTLAAGRNQGLTTQTRLYWSQPSLFVIVRKPGTESSEAELELGEQEYPAAPNSPPLSVGQSLYRWTLESATPVSLSNNSVRVRRRRLK